MSLRQFAILALGLLLLGCSSGPTPKEVVLSSIDKTSKLASLLSETEINLTVSSQEGTSVSGARSTQYSRDAFSRTDFDFSGTPELADSEIRLYGIGNTSYLCGNAGTWTCLELNDTNGVSGSTITGFSWFSEKGKEFIDSGAIEFKGGVEKREVLGRPCSFVSGIVNYSKLNDPSSPKSVKYSSFSECLDDEFGIALEGRVVVEQETEQGAVLTQADMRVSRFEPNTNLPDSVFELPS